MDLDGNAILLSLLISCIGFVSFTYGRKQGRLPQMVAGIVLMVFPYFVPSLWGMAAIAAGVLALLGLVVRLGY